MLTGDALLAKVKELTSSSNISQEQSIGRTQKKMTNTFIHNLSADKNGGECILLTCTYEEGIMNEELALHSYSSCAIFNTFGVFTSENMFKLAKKLQEFEVIQQLKELK